MEGVLIRVSDGEQLHHGHRSRIGLAGSNVTAEEGIWVVGILGKVQALGGVVGMVMIAADAIADAAVNAIAGENANANANAMPAAVP